MKKGLIVSLVLISILLNVFSIWYIMDVQNNLHNDVISLKGTIIESSKPKISNKELQDYVFNLSYHKDLWYNTLFSLGGISIIFTLIVLLITITTGYIVNQKYDDKFENEYNKIKSMNEASTNDLIMLITNHIGAEKVFARDLDKEYSRMCNAINSYNYLKHFSREDLIDIYNMDIIEFSNSLIGSIINGNIEYIDYYFEIEKEYDQKKILQYIKKNYKFSIKQIVEDTYAPHHDKDELYGKLNEYFDNAFNRIKEYQVY